MLVQKMNEQEKSNNSDEEEQGVFYLFKQQMLKAWQPIPTLSKTIVLFYFMTVVFLGIGIPMIILSADISQYSVQYDTLCSINQTNCVLSLNVSKGMTAPVFVYYQFDHFFQNHRLYAKSVSPSQLEGNDLSVSDISTDCNPIVLNSDLYIKTAIDLTPLNQSAPANPCGMVAYSYFNDTFALSLSAVQVPISFTGIAWPSDIARYKIFNKSQVWTNTTDERFMNWMRIAAMPNFRKLWGRINIDLIPGVYTLTINNFYNIQQFQATKTFVLSTSNFFGSRNQFLSILYLVMGGICFLIATLFLIRKIKKDRKLI